jgi:hypothetical protein
VAARPRRGIIAVISWRRRKEVMWVIGALPKALVYLCRNLGRRRLKRAIRAEDTGGEGGEGGGGVVYGRVGALRGMNGLREARRRVRRNMVGWNKLASHWKERDAVLQSISALEMAQWTGSILGSSSEDDMI